MKKQILIGDDTESAIPDQSTEKKHKILMMSNLNKQNTMFLNSLILYFSSFLIIHISLS